MKKFLLTSLLVVLSHLTGIAQFINFEDSDLKTYLLSASKFNWRAFDQSGNAMSIDANKNGEIEFDEANKVYKLRVSDNGPDSINILTLNDLIFFTNLQFLNVGGTSCQVVDLSNFLSLRQLEIGGSLIDFSLVLDSIPMLDSITIRKGVGEITSFSHINTFPRFATGTAFPAWILNQLSSLEVIQFGGYKPTGGNLNIVGDTDPLDLQNLTNLISADLSYRNLDSIIFPINSKIEFLNISNNNLTTINKKCFPNLKHLDFMDNKIEYFDFSDNKSLNFLKIGGPAFYSNFDSLILTNCTSLDTLYIDYYIGANLDLSNLQSLEMLFISNCVRTVPKPIIGLITLNISNCTSLYTLSLSWCPELETLWTNSCGSLRNCHFSDCPVLKTIDLSCVKAIEYLYLNDLNDSIYINLKNNVDDTNIAITSAWTMCCGSLIIDPGEEILAIKYPKLNVSPYLSFTPPCNHKIITGHVQFDILNNGCKEGLNLNHVKIFDSNVLYGQVSYTDCLGHFVYYSPVELSEISLSLGQFSLEDFGFFEPVQIDMSNGLDSANVDFCLTTPINSFNDLDIELIPLNAARPGFEAHYKIQYRNLGAIPQTSYISLHYDENLMDLLDSNPDVDSTATNYLVWFFEDLLPFETREILIDLKLNAPTDPNYPLLEGHLLNFVATINTEIDDVDPTNNRSNVIQTVVNSFDPNDKTCLEGESLLQDDIGDFLHYLIRFENTGTAEAVNIVVRDIIDTTVFDPSSFWVVSSSHSVQTRLTEGNILEFIFENINLPFEDETNDGYVLFKLRTRPDLQLFDELENSAEIYFDFNFPIVTNTAVTTVVNTVALDPTDASSSLSGRLVPNPAGDWFELDGVPSVQQVDVLSLDGSIFFHMPGEQPRYSIAGIPTGMYIVRVLSDQGMGAFKLIKQ